MGTQKKGKGAPTPKDRAVDSKQPGRRQLLRAVVAIGFVREYDCFVRDCFVR